MKFDPPLVPARFIRRYKRFLVDAELPDGRFVVAHSTNTGALTGCLEPGAKCLLQPVPPESTRKLRYTFEMIRVGGRYVDVNTARATTLVMEALAKERIPALAGYSRHITEWPFADDTKSRVDIVLSRGGRRDPDAKKSSRLPFVDDERVYVELKSTTLVHGDVAAFPDAPTVRGRAHLERLMEVVARGQRGAMLYVVTRSGTKTFRPADEVDPEYGRLLREATQKGVECYAFGTRVGERSLTLGAALEIDLTG